MTVLPFFFPIDSYKLSHALQYPSGTQKLHCYLSARSAKVYPQLYFFGTEYYLHKLREWAEVIASFCHKPTQKRYGQYFAAHGFDTQGLVEQFTRLGQYVRVHKRLPLRIGAREQSQLCDIGDTLLWVENTDDSFFWLPTFVESLLLKIWYPTTVATKCYFVKQILTDFWKKTSCSPIEGVHYQFHNFGDRGSSSTETAYIGGRAHLALFRGTDNFMASLDADGRTDGFSIPAMEHSTVISWGRLHEYQAYENMLEVYKHCHSIAMVVDSYDTYASVHFITSQLREKIESPEYPTVVLRPDSGDPLRVCTEILRICERNGVCYDQNAKGYKVMRKFRLICGDAITAETIRLILKHVTERGYSSENMVFGSGGWLMQQDNRDTLGFAYKASAIQRNDQWEDIYKQPITDSQKTSKRGLQYHKDLTEIY